MAAPCFPITILNGYYDDDDSEDSSYYCDSETETEDFSFTSDDYSYEEYDCVDKAVVAMAAASSSSSSSDYVPDSEPESESSSGNKRKLKSVTVANESTQKENSEKPLFQRVWSDEDEIAILNGLFEFAQNKRANPVSTASEKSEFYSFIRSSFQKNVSKVQLADKIFRLKKRYENNSKKQKSGSSKSHEDKLFQLSKKVWGYGVADEGLECSTKPKTKPEKVSNSDFDGLEEYMKKFISDFHLIEEKKKAEMQEKWNEMSLAALEHFCRHSELKWELMRLALDAMKSAHRL